MTAVDSWGKARQTWPQAVWRASRWSTARGRDDGREVPYSDSDTPTSRSDIPPRCVIKESDAAVRRRAVLAQTVTI